MAFLGYRSRNRDDSISDKTIVAITAAWVVASFAFTALLPSILTRPNVDFTALPISPAPVQPAQIEPFGVIKPVPDPGPAQLPAPVLPAPAASDSTSAAKTAPAFNSTGSVTSEKQADGPVTGAEVLVRSAGKAAASRPVLTAAERAAVARGRQELENTDAIDAPRRPAPTRPSLTDEEKAAVARGLRELEKAAGQAKQ
jgi:hypothetical protein